MPEIHLKKPGFTQSACGKLTKNKERIKKVMQTGNTNYIYKNDLDTTCLYLPGFDLALPADFLSKNL